MTNAFRFHQTSFAGGVISDGVSARYDLEKYGSSLLEAKNAIIRPYGGLYKRTGTVYCGPTKYENKKTILRKFNITDRDCFGLEIGEGYIRIWKQGVYTGVEVSTQYIESDLENLRFTQSADVMFIASGRLPVMQLSRFADDNWTFEETDFYIMPFQPINDDEALKVAAAVEGNSFSERYSSPGVYVYKTVVSANYTISIGGAGGYGWSKGRGGNGALVTKEIHLDAGTEITINIGRGGQWYTHINTDIIPGRSYIRIGYNGENSSVFIGGTSYVAGGGGGGTIEEKGLYLSGTNGETAGNGLGGIGGSAANGSSGAHGFVNISWGTLGTGNQLTSSKDLFTQGMVGGQMKIVHDLPTTDEEVSYASGSSGNKVSNAILVGDSWALITRGTWKGNVKVQESKDGNTWVTIRTFTSDADFNANATGAIDGDPKYMRINVTLTSTTSTSSSFSFTSFAYSHDGIVKITSVLDPRNAIFSAIKPIANSSATDLWYMSSWNFENGFPVTLSFFQDRFSLAGSYKQPNTAWFSRTGDYTNFGVDKADGKITDDSAISVNIITREMFDIRYIVPAQDFIILTSGNEWIISGSSILTPSDMNPRMQTAWGCSLVEPLYIGNRVVYCQRRGGKIRDMGYSYESDNYTGNDLSLLVQHYTDNHSYRSCTYTQEPDSILYFVRDDGVINCLTFVREQNVFAWSEIRTKGTIESVVSLPEASTDKLYAVVRRTINGKENQYIEKFSVINEGEAPTDHIYCDSSVTKESETPFNVIERLDHLIGEKVLVVGDNNLFTQDLSVDDEGTLVLPYACNKAIVGLPYEMRVEFPDVVMEIKGKGTTQGEKKRLSKATFRVKKSFGGKVYTTEPEDSEKIFTTSEHGKNILDEKLTFSLYSGYESVTPMANTNNSGKLVIVHDEPYPFNLLSLTREVVID